MAGTTSPPAHQSGCRGRRLAVAVCAAALAGAGPARAQDEVPPAELALVPPPLQAFLAAVTDDKPIANDGDERHAYNSLLLWCLKEITPDQLAAVARRDITYAHMANRLVRARYRGQPVHLEGRLKRVIKYPAPDDLQASGLTEIYESWLFPDGGNSTYPVVVLTPRAEPGVKAEGDTEGWVRLDAYFFKRYAYEARDEAGKPKWRYAPLLIGPVLPAASVPPGAGQVWSTPAVVLPVTAIGLALVLAVGGLVWSVRRADRRVQSRLEVTRTNNPFAEPPAAPQSQEH